MNSKNMTAESLPTRCLRENSMPIEMFRAELKSQKLTSDFKTSWKLYGEHPTHP